LPGHLDKILHRQRRLQVLQRVSLQILHHHEHVALVIKHIEYRHDVGMLQAGQPPGFIDGKLRAPGGLAHLHADALYGHHPLQLQVAGEQHFTNPSPAQLLFESITSTDHRTCLRRPGAALDIDGNLRVAHYRMSQGLSGSGIFQA
jgi:hypothetical protein